MTNKKSLLISVAVGAVIAFILINIFLTGEYEVKPHWPKYWKIRPLIVVPIAGAIGGFDWWMLRGLRAKGGWIKALAVFLGIFFYIIMLWMGTVLGLDGTLWD